jgi:CRISPR-associated protein Cas1
MVVLVKSNAVLRPHAREENMTEQILPPLKPIPIKDRVSVLYIEKGNLDVLDGAFVVVDKNGVRTHIPVGGVACLMLEPGTRVSHAAVTLASRVGCLLVWIGDAGVRLYASGQPGGARADRLLYQAKLALDDDARLKVVRKMYAMRFKEEPPAKRSVEQLRGIEGVRVRKMYELLARQYGVEWKTRNYDHTEWGSGDVPNRCLSSATACLYGICEAAILAAGYAPAVGFIHTGKPQSFVYDIADIFKFETVVPVAFRVAARKPMNPERDVRLACRDTFRQSKILNRIIPTIEQVLAAGEVTVPKPPPESVEPAIPNKEGMGDAGHRG